MHISRKYKAVSSVVGVIILVTIMIVSVAGVFLVAIPQLDKIEAQTLMTNVYEQLETIDEVHNNIINEKKGNVAENKISVEAGGEININPQNDRLAVVYSKSADYKADIDGLLDYDDEFSLKMIKGSATSCKVTWHSLRTPYGMSPLEYSSHITDDYESELFFMGNIYNFSDTTNNKAYYTTQGSPIPLSPEDPAYVEYTPAKYENISENDDRLNEWDGFSGKYVNLIYKFKILDKPCDIAYVDFNFVGYDDLEWAGYFYIYIWNFTSSNWEVKYSIFLPKTEKETFTARMYWPEEDYVDNDYIIFGVSGSKGPTELKITYPNFFGIVWMQGENRDITWESTLSGNVDIDLYKGGVKNLDIAVVSASDEYYMFLVPPGQTPGTDYRIRITSVSTPSIYDESDYNFTILGSTPTLLGSTCAGTCFGDVTCLGPTCVGTCDGSTCLATCEGVTCDSYTCQDTCPPCIGITSGATCLGSCSGATCAGGSTCTATCGSTCGSTCTATCVESCTGTCTASCSNNCPPLLCCFPKGTKITLADETKKSIEDIKVYDQILSYDINNHTYVVSSVSNWTISLREGVYSINDGLVCPTDDHPLYIMKSDGRLGWAAINPEKSRINYDYRNPTSLEIGDWLFCLDGSWVKVESIEFKPGLIETYTFSTDSEVHNYFADDVLVSNLKGSGQACTSTPGEQGDCQVWSPFEDNVNNDYRDFIDDFIIFSDKGISKGISGGIAPGYNSDDVGSPLFSFKTAEGIDQITSFCDVSFLGQSKSFSKSEDELSFTLYEYYADIDVHYNLSDNIPPWSNITSGPLNNEEISYNVPINFQWEGHDDLSDSADIVYKFRLEPFDTEWRPSQDSWTEESDVTYHNMPPGDYVFRVRSVDKAHNIETIENDSNTRAFTILPNSTTIIESYETNSEVIIDTGNPLVDFVGIDIYDAAYSSTEPVICVYVFDFMTLDYDISSSIGSYKYSFVNGGIAYSDGTQSYLQKKPNFYDEGGVFIPQIIQHTVPITGATLQGFSGDAHYLSSRLVENQILVDDDIYSFELQGIGNSWNAFKEYLVDSTHLEKDLSNENILTYPMPMGSEIKLIMLHFIIELYLD